jgi:hypothetical protein
MMDCQPYAPVGAMFRSLCVTLALLFGQSVQAATIDVVKTIALEEVQVSNCLSASGSTEPTCWFAFTPTTSSGPEFSPVTLMPGDTLRITVMFADGYRLRWTDDGVTIPCGACFGDEWIQMTVTDQGGPGSGISLSGIYTNKFSFLDVSGELLANHVYWEWDSLGLNSGLSLRSDLGGPTNFTDSWFEFSGFSAELGLASATGLPATFFQFSTIFHSARFSFIEPVPIPAAAWLFGGAIVALSGLRRRAE